MDTNSAITFDSSEDRFIYNSRIAYYKEKREKYQLIETGKEIGENLHITKLNFLNGKTESVVNLLNKFTNLIWELDSTNINIIELNEIWKEIHPNNSKEPQNSLSNSYHLRRMLKLQEYIIFDLYKFISQTIAAVWILQNPAEKEVKVPDIGAYLYINNPSNKSTLIFEDFSYFQDYFQTINNLFNAYKHSFAYNDKIFLGFDEIIFFAIDVKKNNFSKTPKCHYISLEDLISTFNEFYEYSKTLIDNLTKTPPN